MINIQRHYAFFMLLTALSPAAVMAQEDRTPPMAIRDEAALKAGMGELFSAIAGGKILGNQHFVLMAAAARVYAQEGYLDTTRPITKKSYKRLVDSPPLFGAMLYLHRDMFAGDWDFQIRIFEGELAYVTATNGDNALKLLLSRGMDIQSMTPAWLIEIDSCSYNGKSFPWLFGYVHGTLQAHREDVPQGLPQTELRKIREVISSQQAK